MMSGRAGPGGTKERQGMPPAPPRQGQQDNRQAMPIDPHEFPRRILLAVTGLSPQVVTETLYALAVQRAQPFIPTEIHLLTTAEGRQRAELALLSDDPGWFHRLRADYGLPPIIFDVNRIHAVSGADGRPLDDIRTPLENERLADWVTEKMRELTHDPDAALHVSIAGGRKTMGFYLGYALSLFGRPQDRLSHVLVNEPYESSWDFFYPTPYSRVITTRDNKLADTRDARVELAEIPFVRLRQGLDRQLQSGGVTFSEAVAAAQQALQPPELVIDREGQCILAGGRRIALPPKQLALLGLFADRLLQGRAPLPAPGKEVPDPEWAKRFLEQYRAIRNGDIDDIERTERALHDGMDGEYFSSTKSKLHRTLKVALGPAAQPYLIDDGGTRPRRYSLNLPREAVRFGRLAASTPHDPEGQTFAKEEDH